MNGGKELVYTSPDLKVISVKCDRRLHVPAGTAHNAFPVAGAISWRRFHSERPVSRSDAGCAGRSFTCYSRAELARVIAQITTRNDQRLNTLKKTAIRSARPVPSIQL